MITSAHVTLYVDDAEAVRAFFRDVLGFPHVDAGDGWLVFRLPPTEAGIHPTGEHAPPHGSSELFLMCDDVAATVAELRGKGVEFASEVSDQGWGLLTSFRVPGGGTIGLYQPKHPTSVDAPS